MFSVKQFFESCGTADNGCSDIITRDGDKTLFYKAFYQMVTRISPPEIYSLDNLVQLMKIHATNRSEDIDTIIINDSTGHKVGHAEFIRNINDTFVICYYAGDNCEKIAYHEFMDKGTDVIGVYISN